jgi:hypothetical protein
MHTTHHITSSGADTDTPVAVTPADTMRGAARYLTAHGLHQGSYYPGPDQPSDPGYQPFPPACAVGALAMAAHGRRHDSVYSCLDQPAGLRAFNSAVNALTDYLDRVEEPPPGDPLLWDATIIDQGSNPFAWNDHPDRTADQVIAVLYAAADDWDRTHGGAR